MNEQNKKLNVCICTINTQYIHSSPVGYGLKAIYDIYGDGNADILVKEFSINDRRFNVLRAIMKNRPDVVCFSCYLWNIEMINSLKSDIKKIDSEIIVVLGGPEVSHVATPEAAAHADYILDTEGELVFPEFIDFLAKSRPSADVALAGSWSCADAEMADRWTCAEYQMKLADDMLANATGRIAYLETSRGCPFGCIYCLASAEAAKVQAHTNFHRVRYLPDELVQKLIARYGRSGASQIKLTDRTFNASGNRALRVMQMILDEYNRAMAEGVNFLMGWHFEVAADLITDEMVRLVEMAPRGLYQFEVGLQSLDDEVLKTACRKTDTELVLANISRLMNTGNCKVHTDLIAGLPGEGYCSFIDGFNRLMLNFPDEVQVGFLKLLKGAFLNDLDIAEYGMVYSDNPPYEVLKTGNISYEELELLKRLANSVDVLWNSGRFRRTVKHLVEKEIENGLRPIDVFILFDNLLGQRPEGPMSQQKLNQVVYELILTSFGELSSECSNENFGELSSEVLDDFIIDVATHGFKGKLPIELQSIIGNDKIVFKDILTKLEKGNIVPKGNKNLGFWRLTRGKTLAVDYSRADRVSGEFFFVILGES